MYKQNINSDGIGMLILQIMQCKFHPVINGSVQVDIRLYSNIIYRIVRKAHCPVRWHKYLVSRTSEIYLVGIAVVKRAVTGRAQELHLFTLLCDEQKVFCRTSRCLVGKNNN